MFSFKFRIVLWSVLVILSSVFFLVLKDNALGFIFLFFLAWNMFSYVRNGTVMSAFYQIKKGNLQRSQELIQEIRFQKWLSFKSQCYYSYTKGYIALGNNKNKEAVDSFKKSIVGGLKRIDQIIALLNLIKLTASNRDKSVSEEYYRILTTNYKIPKSLKKDFEGVKLLLAK